SKPPSSPPRKPIVAKTPRRLVGSITRSFGVASRAGSSPPSDGGTGRLPAPPRLVASPSSFSSARGPACRVLYPWCPVSTTRASSRKNDSTSVTSPTDCQLPRSASLVTTAGLMSTHTVRTPAGSMLPVAMECSIVESIKAMRTPPSAARMRLCASTMSVITSGSGPSSRTRVDHGRSRHHQDAATGIASLAHLLRDAGDEDLLWFFRRDLAAHEAEDLCLPRAFERRHPHALVADHDLHPRPGVLKHDAARATGPAIHRDRGVHLDVVDHDPLAVEQNLGWKVAGRVEALRKDALARDRFEAHRLLVFGRRTQGPGALDDAVEELRRVGVHLHPADRRVGLVLADLQLLDGEVATEVH